MSKKCHQCGQELADDLNSALLAVQSRICRVILLLKSIEYKA